jgi:hypothetical protein
MTTFDVGRSSLAGAVAVLAVVGLDCELAADDGDALADDDALDDALLELVPPFPPFCDPPLLFPVLVALVRARSSPRVALDGHEKGSCGG